MLITINNYGKESSLKYQISGRVNLSNKGDDFTLEGITTLVMTRDGDVVTIRMDYKSDRLFIQSNTIHPISVEQEVDMGQKLYDAIKDINWDYPPEAKKILKKFVVGTNKYIIDRCQEVLG